MQLSNRLSISFFVRNRASRLTSPVAALIFSFATWSFDMLMYVSSLLLTILKSRMKLMMSYAFTLPLKHFSSSTRRRNRLYVFSILVITDYWSFLDLQIFYTSVLPLFFHIAFSMYFLYNTILEFFLKQWRWILWKRRSEYSVYCFVLRH